MRNELDVVLCIEVNHAINTLGQIYCVVWLRNLLMYAKFNAVEALLVNILNRTNFIEKYVAYLSFIYPSKTKSTPLKSRPLSILLTEASGTLWIAAAILSQGEQYSEVKIQTERTLKRYLGNNATCHISRNEYDLKSSKKLFGVIETFLC